MERIENVNPNRLKWCCEELGITLDSLAQTVGIPLENIQRVMDGAPGFTFLQLRKVADFFGRGVLFFLETGEVAAAELHTSQFRTINNQKPSLSPKIRRLIERVERQRQIYLDLQEELGEPAISFSPPVEISDRRIADAAAYARQWLGLSGQNDFNSYRAAVEDKGVLVFRSNGFGGKWQIPKDDPVCGFSLFYEQCPLIFVKKQASENRQTFTMMHELGHLLLHKNSFIDDVYDLFSYKGKEYEANSFAGQVLVPPAIVDQINDQDRPGDVRKYDDWLKPFSSYLGISTHVLLLRLVGEKRLSQPLYEAYRDWKDGLVVAEKEGGNRSYRYREPIHVFGDTFVRTVLESLQSKNISLARASTYLDNLKIADVHKLEGTYAGF